MEAVRIEGGKGLRDAVAAARQSSRLTLTRAGRQAGADGSSFCFHQKRPQALFGAAVFPCDMFLGCRISKIVVDQSKFPLLTCSSLQQEIPEAEAVQLALVQVASEKQEAQHGPLLRRNVEGVKLETAHCLKLGQTLRMQCETAISEVFQGFSQTILFLLLVLL